MIAGTSGRAALLAGLLALAACGRSGDTASTADAEAMAAATRKAVADTDAALRDAAVRNPQHTEQTTN